MAADTGGFERAAPVGDTGGFERDTGGFERAAPPASATGFHLFGTKPTMDPVFHAAAAPVINMLDYPVRAAIGDIAAAIPGVGAFPIGQEARDKWQKVRDQIIEAGALPENEVGKNVSAALSLPGTLIGKGVGALSRATLGPETTAALAPFAVTAADVAPFRAGKVLKDTGIADLVAGKNAARADEWVNSAYSKAVGPRPAGRDTPLQRRQAIDEIITNKPNLQYTDPTGKPIASGRAPESLDEFSQAIDQTKSRLFDQWDQLSLTAGSAGAMVDLSPVVGSLRAMEADQSLLRVNPAAARYAGRMADRYEQFGRIAPHAAQQDLKVLNQKLKGYYRNPVPIAPAEEEAARVLRHELDQTIENTVAPGYQDLRNRYTALRAIEDDVERATRRVANWRAGGGVFGPLLNVTSLATAAEGIWHGDWKALAAAGVTKALGEMQRARSHPNAIVKRIFDRAEKISGQPTAPRPFPQLPAGAYIGGTALQPQQQADVQGAINQILGMR